MKSASNLILITGSSGRLGSASVRALSDRFRIVGFDRDGDPHPPPEAECVCVDLTSEESIDAGMKRVREGYGTKIASVVHFAAYYDFSGEPSAKYEEVTVRGTERLLRALRPFEVEQFIFSSTMLVHAPCEPGERINEDWPLEPKWDYPLSKVATEKVISEHRGSMKSVSLRIAGVYDDECHSIPLAHQIERIFERKLTSRVYPGDPSRGQAFVHLDDVVDAVCRCIDRRCQLPPEATLLIGEPETLGYEDLQSEFGRLIHDEPWETKTISKTLAKTGAWLQDHMPLAEEPFIKPWMVDLADDHYALDIGRAREVLGWEPRHSLRATLPAMISALRQSPAIWYRENGLEPPSWIKDESDAKL
ncbi:MAG TPA: NAD(P)-dependent oxidoreductase [Pirellulaceae bacterium]|nr:NAD(P)-dependent oxidoreductase [Pirellulaceae bacterium]